MQLLPWGGNYIIDHSDFLNHFLTLPSFFFVSPSLLLCLSCSFPVFLLCYILRS